MGVAEGEEVSDGGGREKTGEREREKFEKSQ